MSESPGTTRERLSVPGWWWLLAIGLALTFVIAVSAYTNLWFGAATALLSLLLVAALFLIWGQVPVAVDGSGFTAGPSRVEWPWVASVEALDAEQMHRATGTDALATAHLVVRPYVRTGVRVVLDDPADPHPYWLVSTRHPQRTARAAAAQLAAAHPGGEVTP